MRIYAYKWEEGLKNRSSETYILNGWPQTNVVGCFLCIDRASLGTAKYTKTSAPARKMWLFSSIIITIILSYVIIRIYVTLHIHLQVSETEGLANLHWVIGQSALEKINSIYFHTEYYLRFQECSFKNPNVLNIEASYVTSLHEI